MNTDVSCYGCHEHICAVDGDIQPVVFPMAVNVDEHQMMFNIKCPHCGRVNHIKLIRSEQAEVRKY